MTKSELIKRIKERFQGTSTAEATDIVETILGEISTALVDGNRVELRGFGSFSVRRREPRQARNPKTGEKVKLGVRHSVYFRPGRELRAFVNGEQ